jgi:hypothetical protein
MKDFIDMGAYMTTEYNSNSNCVCVMCDKTKDEGTVKNGKFVCNECIDGLVPNQTKTVPVMHTAQHVAPFFAQPSNRLTVYPTKINSRAGTFEY